MRILALLGLGLPVVAVSGAVAYGSVAQISHSFKAQRAPAVIVGAVPARPSEAAQDFVIASAGAWDIAPEAAIAREVQDITALSERSEQVSSTDRDLRENPFEGNSRIAEAPEVPEIELAVVTERPIAVTQQLVVRPRVVVSADRTRADEFRAQRTNQNRKREFRMPWQTGVFQ
ncbi:MAG: hypothetical protein ACK4GW_08110 [Pseudorhodobacter sp.]